MGAGLVRLMHTPFAVGVNTTVSITGDNIGGFLCVTSGTITVVGTTDQGANVTWINAMPVTAGTWYFMPFYIGPRNGSVTTAGGASGVLAT